MSVLVRAGGASALGGNRARGLWTPNNLGTAVIDWYAPESYVAATPVWNDLGSSGNTLAVVTNDPAFDVQMNGRDTLSFDGGAALRHVIGSLNHASTPVEVYVACRLGLPSPTQRILDGSSIVNRLQALVITSGVFRVASGTNLSSAADTLKKDTPTLLRIHAAGTSSVLYVWTGSAWTTVATGSIGTGLWDGLTVGGQYDATAEFSGVIAEVLRVTASGDDPARVGAYFQRRYPVLRTWSWAPWDLMCGGDSNWVGLGSTDGKGVRSLLHAAFETNDIEPGVRTLRQVGLSRDSCLSSYAQSGRIIATIRDGIATQISTYAPSCILLWIGTNDCRNLDGTYDPVTTPAKLYATLDNIDLAGFTGPVILAQIPPLANATHNANVDDYNDEITRTGGIFEYGQSLGLTMVPLDLNTGVVLGTHFDVDGIHFNDAGFSQIVLPRVEAAIRSAA